MRTWSRIETRDTERSTGPVISMGPLIGSWDDFERVPALVSRRPKASPESYPAAKPAGGLPCTDGKGSNLLKRGASKGLSDRPPARLERTPKA